MKSQPSSNHPKHLLQIMGGQLWPNFLPILAWKRAPWFDYLSAAAEAGIIAQGDSETEFFLTTLDPGTAESDILSSTIKHNFKLLEGAWFELAVLRYLQSLTSFSDVQWSVEADASLAPNPDSLGETDIVAFNSHTLNLHFISCKTTGPHGAALDHIQGLRRRATKEGGEFAKAELWIFAPKNARSKESLENHCKEQGVTLRVFTDMQP